MKFTKLAVLIEFLYFLIDLLGKIKRRSMLIFVE